MKQLKISHSITNRESQSVEKYLKEISKGELITAEDEVVLAQKIRMGDRSALERLTKANLRFVVSIAKQYQGQGLTLGDLINEGNLGLMKAAKRFDETKGFKFISYAVWWIRQSILIAIADQSRIVRLPLNQTSAAAKIRKTSSLLEQQLEREPTSQEIAETLELSIHDITDTLANSSHHTSLDTPITQRENSADTLLDLIDNGGVSADQGLINESLRRDIAALLSKFDERNRTIITYYFGLNGTPAMSMDEIAERLHLTRERVRQIKDWTLKKIQGKKSTLQLKVYL